MRPDQSRSAPGLSGLLAVGILLTISASLSGCRFGNYVERRDTSLEGRVLGYYATSPQLFELCVELDDGAGGLERRCREVYDYATIPGELHATDPSLLVIDDPKTARITIRRKNDIDRGFAATLAEGTGFTWDQSGSAKAFWGSTEDGCFHTPRSTGTGSYRTVAGMSPSADGLSLSGTFEFTGEFSILMSESSPGACGPLLAEVRQCYLDFSKCPYVSEIEKEQQQMQLHLDVRAYFRDPIEASALTDAELDRYRGVIYRVVSR
jgi:hypothetical protein